MWTYPGNTHEAQHFRGTKKKKERWRINDDETNATYEIIDERPKNYCHRLAALERSVEKLLECVGRVVCLCVWEGGLKKFYWSETSLKILIQV